MDNPQFPNFRQDLKEFVELNSIRPGQKNLTIPDIQDWVHEYLNIDMDIEKYCPQTISNWLHELGFFRKDATKKGIYIDRHNAEENVAARKTLYDNLKSYEPDMLKVDPRTLEIVNRPTAKYITISQDESSWKSSDVQRMYWGTKDSSTLPAKNDGARVMTSDFITLDGNLMFNDDSWEQVKDQPKFKERVEKLGEFEARLCGRIMEKEYYNAEMYAEDIEMACLCIELNYNGQLKPVFLVDHSPIHTACSPNSLNAKHMNVTDGGKQRKQRDTFFYKTNENGDRIKVHQDMTYKDGEKAGTAKGLVTVCTERFGEEAVKKKIKRELVAMLMAEEDFAADSKTWIEEIVEAHGGKVEWCAKYHPELNPVESWYRDLSRESRYLNIAGNTKGFKKRIVYVIRILIEDEKMLYRIRRYFLSSARFLEAYQMPNCTPENVETFYKYLKEIEGLSTKRTRHRQGVNLELEEEAKPRKKSTKSFLVRTKERGDEASEASSDVEIPNNEDNDAEDENNDVNDVEEAAEPAVQEVEPQPGPSGLGTRAKKPNPFVEDSDSDASLVEAFKNTMSSEDLFASPASKKPKKVSKIFSSDSKEKGSKDSDEDLFSSPEFLALKKRRKQSKMFSSDSEDEGSKDSFDFDKWYDDNF